MSNNLLNGSFIDWEGFIDETYDELNQSHEECELSLFYVMLQGLNSLDHAYQ